MWHIHQAQFGSATGSDLAHQGESLCAMPREHQMPTAICVDILGKSDMDRKRRCRVRAEHRADHRDQRALFAQPGML